MLKFEEICELIQLVGSSGVARVEIEHAGGRVQIEGRPQAQVISVPASTDHQAIAVAAMAEPDAQAIGGAAAAVPEVEDGLQVLPSPIVGTFYRAPNPDADPYVRVGDLVREGQVLCIVEAMKLMNEIQSEVDGTIVKVFPENAEPVEYGQPLFSIRPV
ncbi:MAG: acetyl-CoA carboxylase biotin carboxyl carrier protein [Thermoanaerobaculales bacterium]|nr:acetyl-CoA carboxylase biotin carboxyl carrier protein [Thermoanaerobaculales bacterium]